MTEVKERQIQLAKDIWILGEYMSNPAISLHHREHEILLKLFDKFAVGRDEKITYYYELALKELENHGEILLMTLSRLRNFVHEFLKENGIDTENDTLQTREYNVSTIIEGNLPI